MPACQCQGIEDLFNDKSVRRELRTYRRKGPEKTTRMLIAALQREGVQGASLLDIGGGLGALQHGLLASGAVQAVDVDASQSYITAAREEAARRGLQDRIRFLHGNFVDEAPGIDTADIVTLDRVICCYDDMHRLVDTSAEHARRFYGLVFPMDAWWSHLAMRLLNFFMRLQRTSYRGFIHPTADVEALIASHGLNRRYYARSGFWQVAVYAR